MPAQKPGGKERSENLKQETLQAMEYNSSLTSHSQPLPVMQNNDQACTEPPVGVEVAPSLIPFLF